MAATIAQNLHRLDRSAYDAVVGIPRSGMIPASIIATSLQLPLTTPEAYRAGIIHGRSGRAEPAGKRILLVDDSCNKGRAMVRAVGLLPKGTQYDRLAVYGPYQLPDPAAVVDITFADCHGPRVFAWNMWKHIRLARWGFDFDGVFCPDPTKSDNDDGARYRAFMAGAPPLFVPSRPIGHIVTCRLERYRKETEAQLARYGIQFESLTMMPFETKAERMAAGNRGGWKAQQVKRLGVELFIESCPKQAGIIAREAGVPVWCTKEQRIVQP